MDEILNDVNASQEQVVDVPTGEETAGLTAEETPATEPSATEEVAKPQQSAEENAKFAEFRRKAEQAEREAQKIKAENERLLAALNQYGYEGSPQEIADLLLAQQQGITPEEARQQREAEEAARQQQAQIEQELAFYRNIAIENLKTKDLNTIKAAYPEVKASKIEELGETFINIFNTGKVSALEAYEASKVIEARSKKPIPPSLGGVNETNNTGKDFYTPDEVDRLTDADYDRDPKLWERVRKSMLKWK